MHSIGKFLSDCCRVNKRVGGRTRRVGGAVDGVANFALMEVKNLLYINKQISPKMEKDPINLICFNIYIDSRYQRLIL